jgi:hypothetical protein
MNRFCAACGTSAAWLSMKALCPRCQKTPGALRRRVYDWRTGKRKAGDVVVGIAR